MRAKWNKTLVGAAALTLMMGASGAHAVEVWTTITSHAASKTAGPYPTLSGTLGPTEITFSSFSTAATPVEVAGLRHLPSVDPQGEYSHIWDNNATGKLNATPTYSFAPNSAQIYPASAATAPSQITMGNGAGNRVVIQFGTPITNPVLLVYSVDPASILNLGNTQKSDGTAVDVTLVDSNPAGVYTANTHVFRNVYTAPNQASPTIGNWALEGCSERPNFPEAVNADTSNTQKPARACGVFQFTGTYTQLVIAGNRNDGIGMQVGYDAPPPPVVSLVCTPELLKDSANQESVCQITATGPVPNDVAVALTVTTSAGSRYTSNCPATLTIPAGSTTSPTCKITATPNTVAGDGSETATVSITPAPAAAYPAYTVGNGAADVEVQDDEAARLPPPGNANAVPTIGEWALMLLSALLMGAAALVTRGRKSMF